MNKGLMLPLWAVLMLLVGCASQPFPTTLTAVEDAAVSEQTLQIQQWQTAEGATVMFVPSPNLPMLDLRLVFNAGSARDGDLQGVASLASALIGEGTASLNVDEIAQHFESLGVTFGASSYRDMAIVEMRTLTEADFLEPAQSLFIDVVANPTFPQQSLERIRAQILKGFQANKQVPGPQISKAYYQLLFGQHPYAHPSQGTEESVVQIQQAHVSAFFERYYAAQNAVIAMTGDISREQAEQLANNISQALPQGQQAPALERAARADSRQVQHLVFPSSQTIVMMGSQSIWRGHPDWVPLYVGNHILGGGGFGSILMDNVRDEKGYVYGIGSSFSPMAAAGPFSVRFSTANENAADAIDLTLSLMSEFVEQGPSQAQVDNAVANIIGSFPLGLAENDDIVGQLGAMGFYDLPLDYLAWFQRQVKSMTPDKIHQAFKRNLAPEQLAIVTIGPEMPAATAIKDAMQNAMQNTRENVTEQETNPVDPLITEKSKDGDQ